MNYYVVCTCEVDSSDPTGPAMDCPMHGKPTETHTETSGEGEMFIDMEAR